MKKCFKCGEEKELTEFYKHSEMQDGYLNKCKECTKKDTKVNYRLNHDHYVSYEKQRAKLPHRKEQHKKYLQTESGKASMKKAYKKYNHSAKGRENYRRDRLKNPFKIAARKILNEAIRKGILTRGKCEICENTKTEAHHSDYNFPLNVKWLCTKCHKHLHATQG